MMKKYIFLAACALGLSLTSCEDFLDYTPTAVVDEEQAFSEPEKMVNSAYAMLGDCWYTSNPQLSSSASFLRLNVLSSLN